MNDEFEDSMAWRKALRREMIARRSRLSDEVHRSLSSAIGEHLRSTFPVPESFAFCWPIKHEPDLRSIAECWCQSGAQAALPVVVDENAPLRFRAWTSGSTLCEDRYGIPTPVDGEWLVPALILLPLNAFDPAGYRLGYGGGYFDRTLAALHPRPLTIGVGFEINRVDSIRPEAHDQRLDWIVTETGAFRPGG